MTDERGLRQALHRQADELGHTHPLSLEDVRGRARGIRRRRAAVSGLAAAAVLAVAAPIGLAVTGEGSNAEPPVAGPSPDTRGPEVPYIDERGVLSRPGTDGTSIELPERFDAFAPLGDGFVGVELSTGELTVIDATGEVVRAAESTGRLAVSEDGTVVAYATPDGRLMTLGTSGGPVELPRPLEGAGYVEPAVVKGSESCDLAEGPGCVVYYNVQTEGATKAYHSTSKGITSEQPELVHVSDESVDGRLSGLVSLGDDGSCSAIIGPDGSSEWETCDFSLGAFSPDGRYVLGHPAYRSGAGDTSVAIIDVETHEVVAEWRSDRDSSYVAAEPVWDTDGTVLAQVWDGRWQLLRMTPDGGLTPVLRDLESKDPYTPPLVLPERA